MCFSATASFVSGGVLCTLGAISINKTMIHREKAMASIPFVFGVQQFIEGFIWLSSSEIQTKILTYAYSFFALVLWPIFLPVSVGIIEQHPRRKKWIMRLTIPAAISSVYFVYVLLKYPIYSVIQDSHIQYHFITH